MKIIANRLEIEKYLETKETNILVNNIINDYLENFAHDEHETMDEESLYENMLEDLEIDPLDKEKALEVIQECVEKDIPLGIKKDDTTKIYTHRKDFVEKCYKENKKK